jgi:tRNA pseudouridine38-40 synthase
MLVSRSEDTTAAAAEANARVLVDDIGPNKTPHSAAGSQSAFGSRSIDRRLVREDRAGTSSRGANARRSRSNPAPRVIAYPPTVPRFKLRIEYAGTRYSGWQIQKNARTVAGEIDRATRTVTGRKDFELYGSGRTDAGVHASGQVAHLDVVTTLAPAVLVRRLNDELPADINLLDAVGVPHRFHARHDAIARRYVYQLATRRTAFAKPFVWWVKEPLDLEPMRAAAAAFVGMHDFSSFRARDEKGDDDSPLVKVERVALVADGALILVIVDGSHFLWKMVRRLVGVLVAIGRGEIDDAAAGSFLRAESDMPAKLTAPASGLFLERVFYKGDVLDVPVRAITPVP